MSPTSTEWALFSDWCASWDRDPLPTTAAVVAEFLSAFPASLSTQARRVRAIRRAHESAGASLTLPSVYAERPRLWQDGDRLLDVGAALAQLPKYRKRPGLHGRRDGFILVLAGMMRLTREQCRSIAPSDLTVTESSVIIQGRRIPLAEPAPMCPACAVTRWLRVVGPAWRGNTAKVNQALDSTAADPDEHDCVQPVRGDERIVDGRKVFDRADWLDCGFLAVSIDRYGWVRTDAPISARAITSIVPARRIATDWVEQVGPVERAAGRFDDLSQREFYDAQADVERQAEEAFARSMELLAQAYQLDLDFEDAAKGRRGAA